MSETILSEMLFKAGLVAAQLLLVLLGAPLVSGAIKKVKALLQTRRGPSIFQTYYDIWKLLRKDAVISEHTSWIFRATPYITFLSVATASMLIPAVTTALPFGFAGDVIVVIYLFALARFFSALAGLDAGGAFGGMGSSREMALSSLAEPAMVLAIFTVALVLKSTSLATIAAASARMGLEAFTPAQLLAAMAFLIIVLAETGPIPIDNPDTHLELTMIHEGMLLECSGRYLGLMVWGHSIKQLLLLTLLANVFFPWGVATSLNPVSLLAAFGAYVLKVLGLAVLIGGVESYFAKLRLFKVPELLGASFMLALLALASNYVL
ncbi:MAG: respiratory chain complex I subunit 1 family protein [Syntrophothermus sp.]